MALAGNLQTASLENILQMLQMNNSTGELVLVRNTRRIGIFFIDGAIVYCHSNMPIHSIEELLVKRKQLNHGEMQTNLALQRQSGKDLLAILLENGVLSRRECVDLLEFQSTQIIFEAVGWEEGTFCFEENRKPDSTVILVSRNPIDLVLEGLRLIDEWREIRKVLPPRDSVLEIDFAGTGEMKNVSLSPAGFQLALLINGHRTIDELCALSPVTEFDTCRMLLELMSAGVVKARPGLPSESGSSPVNSPLGVGRERSFDAQIVVAPTLVTTTTFRKAAVHVKGLANDDLPPLSVSSLGLGNLAKMKDRVASIFKTRK